jgi:anti-sigma regulatory factor (Ser/Thr protein kinase)
VRELSLHLLDIAENSVAAGASQVKIQVIEDSKNDLLQMSVEDNGKGMDAEMTARVTDPFVTSRTTRKVGLGIPLLKEAAEACNGFMKITSQVGVGTTLFVQFQRSHIDRMPLGDLTDTFLHLLIANPAIHWLFYYRVDAREFDLDDAPIKAELAGISLTEPDILNYLRKTIETGIQAVQAGDIG